MNKKATKNKSDSENPSYVQESLLMIQGLSHDMIMQVFMAYGSANKHDLRQNCAELIKRIGYVSTFIDFRFPEIHRHPKYKPKTYEAFEKIAESLAPVKPKFSISKMFRKVRRQR